MFKRLRHLEALAFQEAAGTSGSLFFWTHRESLMRALILIAAGLALSACGSSEQTDNSQNSDENLTAENIVSNDVTAIDAVTGDAANMAGESDVNDIGPPNGVNDEELNAPAKAVTARTSKPPAQAAPAADATSNQSNGTGNSAD